MHGFVKVLLKALVDARNGPPPYAPPRKEASSSSRSPYSGGRYESETPQPNFPKRRRLGMRTSAPPATEVLMVDKHIDVATYKFIYTARFNAETVKNLLHTLNDGKISKKKFNMRLAPEETSMKLTGYEHNGVTCVGMKTDIPVILDEAIVKLNPDFFWLGGGEVDIKLGIKTPEFINYTKPFIINCSGH
ncbi:uncharacterized protein LOC121796871 [Salvia splendens]|uniref:uncharacterized protein LOC121796871 n=1 Tax=Salvia splendens TaxID=180675 RepID=UPI001C26225D|nr:uncharacterized protein LOC121796871 [Salvia splendens]